MSNKDSNTVKTQKAWGEAYLSRNQDPHQKFADLMNMPLQQAKELAWRIASEAGDTLLGVLEEAAQRQEYLDTLPTLGELFADRGLVVISQDAFARSTSNLFMVLAKSTAENKGEGWFITKDNDGRLLLVAKNTSNINWDIKVDV